MIPLFRKVPLLPLFAVLFLFFSAGACASLPVSDSSTFSYGDASDIVWPSPPQQPRIKYLSSISGPADAGMRKTWLKKFANQIFGAEKAAVTLLRPYGVFADAGNIYVTDPGNFCLHVFEIAKNNYFHIDAIEGQPFLSPIGIAVDRDGEIFVSDSILRRVVVFNRSGKYRRDIGSPDVFLRPTGVVIDQERVYVTDTLGHRVSVFSKKDGNLLFHFGKQGSANGEFNYPTNAFLYRGSFLYVTDSMNFRVQVFDLNGIFVRSFGRLGDGSGDFSKPKGIALDSEGHVYIADAHFDTVQIFDTEGNLLLTFGSPGRQAGEFILPAGIHIDELDRIYIADSYNNRIQIFQYLKEQESGIAK